ncbi:hypothetical protein [Haliangium ochraceum]|uniref:Elastin (Supravalvular aortic stenosis, Williams-Beuren syndrome)-like protein n=1 Tax=Haliangium ochraceum (strain DSM 14365 / JCM 11303 / SMP-2) TaxID=502025 RepID=D0LZH4_HALO1|nr:hypothetical protein [Haliangium ochraceum]ACY17953.1 elastin (supravalvular aortic stenosis, Williams- Beuren syndrome)-like protein [Haliangium ochraceum DSM 14365]
MTPPSRRALGCRLPRALLVPVLAAGAFAAPAGVAAEERVSAADARAGEGESGQGEGAGEAGPVAHWAVGAGSFLGLTGPAAFGLAAEAQMVPRFWPGPYFGLGVRYRGFRGLASGLVAAGPVFQAAATRPHLAIEMHASAGLRYGPAEPVFGAGVRTQLGLWGPLALALSADGYASFDGARLRLAVMPALMLVLGG